MNTSKLFTKECLAVIWPVEDKTTGKRFHDELDGFVCHSLWLHPPSSDEVAALLENIRVLEGLSSWQFSTSLISVPEYIDLCIDINVGSWEEVRKWPEKLQSILDVIVSAGSFVCWVAPEGAFGWPDLFESGDQVYAAQTHTASYVDVSDLTEPIRYLPDNALSNLRELLVQKMKIKRLNVD